MKDQVTTEHPRTVLSRLDKQEEVQTDVLRRLRLLEENLDLLYRRVGIAYPEPEPAEARAAGWRTE